MNAVLVFLYNVQIRITRSRYTSAILLSAEPQFLFIRSIAFGFADRLSLCETLDLLPRKRKIIPFSSIASDSVGSLLHYAKHSDDNFVRKCKIILTGFSWSRQFLLRNHNYVLHGLEERQRGSVCSLQSLTFLKRWILRLMNLKCVV